MEGVSASDNFAALGLSSRSCALGELAFMSEKPRRSGLPFREKQDRDAGLRSIFLRQAVASSVELVRFATRGRGFTEVPAGLRRWLPRIAGEGLSPPANA